MNRHIRHIFGLGLLASVVILLGLSAPAFAAPSLGVTLERDKTEFPEVFHSDERVDFTVKVKNEAAVIGAPSEGEKLACLNSRTQTWQFDELQHFSGFEFRWVRDGIPLTPWTSGSALSSDLTISTYTVQAADKEHAIQCLVKAINGAETGSLVVASQPVLIVNPQPVVAPPTPNSLTGSSRLPQISGSAQSAAQKLTCTAPEAGWSASNGVSPITWSFEWMRNGESLSDAHQTEGAGPPATSEYELQPADLETKGTFQCIAKATNLSGTALVESPAVGTTTPAPEYSGGFGEDTIPISKSLPPVELAASTVLEPVTVELELLGGEETFAYKVEQAGSGGGWTCETIPASSVQHARAVCSREGRLAPQEEFPTLEVITAFGADAPDLATAKATVLGGGAAPASDEFTFQIEPAIPFGLKNFTARLVDEAGQDYKQAGGHPFGGLSEVTVNQKRGLATDKPSDDEKYPVAQTKQIIVDLPPGIVGNQLALPELCPGVEEVREEECPTASEVGGLHLLLHELSAQVPIYAIEPEFGTPAQFAFPDGIGNVYTFSPHLRPEDGYAISLELAPAPEVNFLESTVTFCDFGLVQATLETGTVCKEKSEPGANPKPLFTIPTRCKVPLTYRVHLNAWETPTFVEGPPFASAEVEGCDKVPFDPTIDLQPTSHQADSPTGLDVNVSMPTEGLEEPDGISQSNLRQAKITFPEGMAVNASAGQGLGACSAGQIKLDTNDPISCPNSSKIGSVEIDAPVIEETLKGSVYIAKQGEVAGSLIGFYMVFDSPKNGILVKLPARVDADPNTGQLVVTVDESPEQPFSAVRMHFPGGPKATLLTPPKCGKYEIKAELVPWSGGASVTQATPFEVNQGPNGGPCPDGALGAKFSAGSEHPVAGKPSPFNLHLSREDGSGRFTGLNLTTPPGESAYLKDIPYCPQSAINAAKAREKEGLAILEANNPSCSQASQLGVASAGAGGGTEPLFVDTGKAYLTGPYKGAPVSLVLIAPALAGSLDLGNVVVQTALALNPETAQVSAVSDAIPTILHGLLLDIRDIRVALSRPHFTLNPTDCDPMSVNATVRGERGASQQLSTHFQATDCDKLSFKPKLGVRLTGGTRRGAHPKLKGTLEAAPGEANIGRAAVTIPRSEFLDQGHIRTICTRVQFAADACPKGSVYGHATATTPLLGYPVKGPVYLRSSSHKLPDLVVDLQGPDWQPIEAVVVGRIDSIKGQIRTTFENAPDVPLTKFVLSMQGGKKGLLVNSRNICATTNKATVALTGHNDAEFTTRPAVKNSKCNSGRKAKSKHKK